MAGNYKSTSGQLLNCQQLQNNTFNGAMSITVKDVIAIKHGNIWIHIESY